MKKHIFSIISILFILLISFLLLKYSGKVYLGIIAFFFLLFFLSLIDKKRILLMFNIGLFIMLTGLIVLFFLKLQKTDEKNLITIKDSNGFIRFSNTLGFAPAKNFTDTSNAFFENTPIYNVKYTIDSNGLRITSPSELNTASSSIVFFGCSYTFGTGLNDNEVLPYILQEAVKDQYTIYNFAFSDYGPQQMLSAIENKKIDSIVKNNPKIFIYVATPDQIHRINKSYNNKRNLKYILDGKSDEPKFIGYYDTNTKQGYKQYLDKTDNKNKPNISNLNLFLSLVLKSKNLLLKKYPESEFHVLLWDYESAYNIDAIIDKFRKKTIQIHLVSDYAPDYKCDMPSCVIYPPYEWHPNYRINKILANCIQNNILKSSVLEEFDNLYNWTKLNSNTGITNNCEMRNSQVSCKENNLIITLEPNEKNKKDKYKSGTIVSNDIYKYGKFTIRVKNSLLPGTIFNFTLDNEVNPFSDIKKIQFQFFGDNKNQVIFSQVCYKFGAKGTKFYYEIYNLGFNSGNDFHDYSILWNKNSISWLVDDKLVYTDTTNRIKYDDEINIGMSQILNVTELKGKIQLTENSANISLPSKINIDYVKYIPLSDTIRLK